MLKGLVHPEFLWLLRVFCLAALGPDRTTPAILAAVPGFCDKATVLQIRALSAQREPAALGAEETIFVSVIGHILHAPDLLLEDNGRNGWTQQDNAAYVINMNALIEHINTEEKLEMVALISLKC